MLAHWTQHSGPSPPFNQHSFEQLLESFYKVLSFESNHWASLGRILPLACAASGKHLCVYLCFLSWEGFRKQTCTSPFWYKLMDQIYTRQQVFCTSFGRSLWHGNEHHGIDPNILSSGHHASWLFHKSCVSLHTCQNAILAHVGILNSACWAFSTFEMHGSITFVWIEFVNGMCLSNSDFEVQSAGYNSAQSPTNW